MDDQDLKELRNDIRCMDMNELTAFGRKHRANPDSIEYQEAKLAWKRREEKRKAFELERKQSAYPVDSSWDLQRIVFFNRHRDDFPWACFAITTKGHFDVLKLPTSTPSNKPSEHERAT
jgi:hypothetical protein